MPLPESVTSVSQNLLVRGKNFVQREIDIRRVQSYKGIIIPHEQYFDEVDEYIHVDKKLSIVALTAGTIFATAATFTESNAAKIKYGIAAAGSIFIAALFTGDRIRGKVNSSNVEKRGLEIRSALMQ